MTTPCRSPAISFEFFPPRSPQVAERLRTAARDLGRMRPQFLSVTCGADGSSTDVTPNAVRLLRRLTGVETAPHLSCVDTPVAQIESLLDTYARLGIRRLVAIRGDRPRDGEPRGELRHGRDLVALVRRHSGRRFRIAVGAYPECHPEAGSLREDVEHLVRKAEAGADEAVTQYCYNADAWLHFRDACDRAGLAIPIVAGIMPIHDFEQVRRFSARCGADVPRWLARAVQGYRDEASRRAFAADAVADLCRKLADAGAPAFHFYTLNRSAPTLAVLARLGDAVDARGDSAAVA